MKADNLLTKTDYLYYLEAPMHLWAKTHGWLEVTAPSDFEQHLMAQGVTVQGLAQEHLRRKIGEQHPGAEIHFETMLTDEDYFARLDAAVYFPDEDVWDIYEIKSGSSIRKEHLLDAAFQHLVAAANLNLRDTFIVHINKQYCRLGELDLDDLFVLENVNQDIRELYEELKITRELALHTTQAQAPDRIETCLKPNDCPCPRLCHPNLPKHPIYDLPRIGKKAVTLRNAGITAITDIPAEFPLSANQARHVEAVRTNQPGIDLDGIRATLGGLVYPLYFLDYETFNPAIPWYNRYAPYQHIVFQYSLHACNSPGVEAAHFEHLAIKNTDPVPALAAELLDTIGPVGTVVVWNKSFEMGRNREMAELYPQFADGLNSINARIFDLMEIFSKGLYVHPDFHGSASIKNVLPVMVPDLTYDRLAINQGDAAMLAWVRMMTAEMDQAEFDQTRKDLLAYCKQDTYAMVRIWQALVDILQRAQNG